MLKTWRLLTSPWAHRPGPASACQTRRRPPGAQHGQAVQAPEMQAIHLEGGHTEHACGLGRIGVGAQPLLGLLRVGVPLGPAVRTRRIEAGGLQGIGAAPSQTWRSTVSVTKRLMSPSLLCSSAKRSAGQGREGVARGHVQPHAQVLACPGGVAQRPGALGRHPRRAGVAVGRQHSSSTGR